MPERSPVLLRTCCAGSSPATLGCPNVPPCCKAPVAPHRALQPSDARTFPRAVAHLLRRM
eukprot:356555-Chlamydomonas_euryale.AAC.2